MRHFNSINHLFDFIYSHVNYEQKNNIPYKTSFSSNIVLQALYLLNNPQRKFNIIHIAGTNGKGSFSYILSALLHSKKLSVGAFTSPHLITLNERILINHSNISDDMLINASNYIYSIYHNLSAKPSFFELITIIALAAFSLANCKYVILETGLGGRLDSTNFASDKLSVINTIDYDHTSSLGNSIYDIASEKAGIIKKSNIVLIGKQRHSVLSLITKTAVKQKAARIVAYNKDFYIKNFKRLNNSKYFSFDLSSNLHPQTSIFSNLIPLHQSLNISLAIQALFLLNINCSFDHINLSLQNLSLKGRFQYFKNICHTIIDGAHNPHAVKALFLNLKIHFKTSKYKVLIISINYGKDFKAIIPILIPFFDLIIICPLKTSFKKDISKQILAFTKAIHNNTIFKNSFIQAFCFAKQFLQKDDLLVITGSFYLVGQALEYIQYIQKQNINPNTNNT